MIAGTVSLRRRRMWRRLEERATRAHDRDLLQKMRELVATEPTVIDATGSWMPGALSLQLSGWRLLLGGVAPSAAWNVLTMAVSPASLRLLKGGRYGKLWWIAVGQEEEQVVVATHLQIRTDPGRPTRSALDLPVLSGAH